MKDSKSFPSFAIILCTHNGENFLRDQLNSILNQTYTEFILFIHDWGSSDMTLEILDEISNKFSNKVFLTKHRTTPGPKESFLRALDLSFLKDKFDFYLFSDQDDVWTPRKLGIIKEKIEEKSPDFLHHDVEVVDSNLKTLEKSLYANNLFFRKPLNHNFSRILSNPVPGMTMCFSNRIVNTIFELKLSNHSNILMHDWFVLLVIIFKKYKSLYINEQLVKYRQHESNILGFNKKSLLKKSINIFFHFRNVINQKYYIENLFQKKISFMRVTLDVISDRSLTYFYRFLLFFISIFIGFEGGIKKVTNFLK